MEEQNSADSPSDEPSSDEPEPIQDAEESPNIEDVEQDTEQETRTIPDSESNIKSDQEPEQTLEEDLSSESDLVVEPGLENQEGNATPDPVEGEISEDDFQQELLDFADLDDLAEMSEEDLREMQEAIAENLEQEPLVEEPEFRPEINAELEQKMQAELAQKQQRKGKALVTKDQLVEYLAVRRTKIVYHALFWLAFESEDHEASKQILYDALKDVTSKDPVESLEEHKFYFGLGFILRLKLLDQKIVKFKAGKLKLTIAIPMFQDMLRIIGDPISERPILTSKEKNKMYTDFLSDDFLDI
ncbi:MAG: hypothetical protein ACTSWW_12405 [Promethearchaeota archaeon]